MYINYGINIFPYNILSTHKISLSKHSRFQLRFIQQNFWLLKWHETRIKLNMFPTRKITSCPYLEASVPINYKKNATVEDSYCSNKIVSVLEKDISTIKEKYIEAGYPNRFMDSIINYFHQTKKYFLIQWSLFEEKKEISFQIPFSKRNEEKMKRIICKLQEYTNTQSIK